MMDWDTLLTVGANFPYTQFMPEFGQARAVSIDLDGARIGLRYPYEENLVGDAQATLARLIPLLERKSDRSWQDDVQGKAATDPINPEQVFGERSPRFPDDAISGSAANWYARPIKMRGLLSGTLPRWATACPTRLAPSSATPIVRSSPWSAAAPCR